MHIVHWVDTVACLLNLLANNLWNEFVHELLEVARGGVIGHAFAHLLANELLLRRVGIARLLQLVLPLLGEADAEQAHHIAVGRLNVHVALNERLPLPDHRAQLVCSKFKTIKLRQASRTLHLLALQLNFAVRLILVLVQVSQANVEDTSLQHLRCNFCASGTCDWRLAACARSEVGGRLDVVPLLLGEGIDDLLSLPLLPLGKTLVLAHSHDSS
mmetsp:Transcript_51696/g.110443  ORF Transcript_51696/g.110443 Transcript_51696/m.110443 type:complete len:215 (-) Transcript_51696:29-673(-)